MLHRFDHDGNHVGSDIRPTGSTADGRDAAVRRARDLLGGWLEALPSLTYGDISVSCFAVEVDGLRFGLVDESDDHGDHGELYPNHLGFHPPWDGDYDT